MSWVRAAQILGALARPRPLPMREIVLDVDGSPGRALVYDPPGQAHGAVAVVPGLAIEAHQDARLHRLAMALSHAGLRGIVLDVPDLDALRIRPETDRDLALRLAAVARTDLVPEGRLGVLAPSFSGSLALRAAALPEASGIVRSVITVGAYANAEPTFRFLFRDPSADPYGRLILLLNFLPHVEPVSEAQLAAIRVALLDTDREPEAAEIAGALAALPAAEAARTRAILEEPDAWAAVGDAILDALGEGLVPLSVAPVIGRLTCSVVLVHGSGDTIVPPTESVSLERALSAAGVDAHLVVTPLLDHANLAFGPATLWEAARVAGALSRFVRGLERR